MLSTKLENELDIVYYILQNTDNIILGTRNIHHVYILNLQTCARLLNSLTKIFRKTADAESKTISLSLKL